MERKLGYMYVDSCDNLCYFVRNDNKWVQRFYDNIYDDNYLMDLAHRIDDIDSRCHKCYYEICNVDLDKLKDNDYYHMNLIKWHLLSAKNELDAAMKICKKHLRSEV